MDFWSERGRQQQSSDAVAAAGPASSARVAAAAGPASSAVPAASAGTVSVISAAAEHERAVATRRADDMAANQLNATTVVNYKAKLKAAGVWLRAHCPNSVDADGFPIVPIRLEDFNAFFGYLMQIPASGDAQGSQNAPAAPNGEGGEAAAAAAALQRGSRKRAGLSSDAPYAHSTVQMYKSAITWWYEEKGAIIDHATALRLNRLLKGYKKEVATMRQSGALPATEGKHPVTFQGYLTLAKKFMSYGPRAAQVTAGGRIRKTQHGTFASMLFGWPYLLLMWNVMARNMTVSKIMLRHLGWEQDALTVIVPKSKSDPEGNNTLPKHVYANPLRPEVCPILALAVLIFCKSSRGDAANPSLFEGKMQDSRFSAMLRQILAHLTTDELANVGSIQSDVGTHSSRKGAASYVSSVVGGPTAISIFQRAGWSLGNVRDRYIFEGDGSDQLCGRTICGLPITTNQFATLPPHLRESDLRELTEERWTDILPLYSQFPVSMKQVVPFLLASILFHAKFLRETLDPHHPLFTSPLYRSGLVERWQDRVLVGTSCSETGLSATGVPIHIVISNSVKELDQRLTQRMAELPHLVKADILRDVRIEGVQPVQRSEWEMLERRLDTITEAVQAILAGRAGTAATSAGASSSASVSRQNDDSQFQMWCWGGTFHPVPEGFKLPRTCIKDFWIMWHHGNPGEKIGRLKQLTNTDLSYGPDICQISRCRKLMKEIESVAREKSYLGATTTVESLSAAESGRVCDKALADILATVGSKARASDLSISRASELLREYEIRVGCRTKQARRVNDQPTD